MTQPSSPATDQHVQSLARGLAVIRAFDAENPAMTLSEVAKRTDLNRAAARRFLHTLVDLGYVRTDGRVFELTPLVLQLGYSFLSGQPLPRIAQPLLEDLSASLRESVSMAVLDGSDIVYVARIHTKRIMSIGISVGTRFPAAVTSMGRALLGGLSDPELRAFLAATTVQPLTDRTITEPDKLFAEIQLAREQGWALVDQELERGLRSVAVPVYNPRGVVVAALNVSMQASLYSAEDSAETVTQVVSALREVAEKILEIQRATPSTA